MKVQLIALLVLGLFCIESRAQSLPEAARRERATQREVAEGRVFTNESIATGRSTSSSDSQTPTTSDPTPSPAPSPSAPSADAGAEGAEGEDDAGTRTEETWREMFREAREELTRSEERLQLTQQEIIDLNQRLLTESSLYNREYQLGPEIQAKQDQLAAAEARVAEVGQGITDLRQELRRAGAPAGWGRP